MLLANPSIPAVATRADRSEAGQSAQVASITRISINPDNVVQSAGIGREDGEHDGSDARYREGFVLGGHPNAHHHRCHSLLPARDICFCESAPSWWCC